MRTSALRRPLATLACLLCGMLIATVPELGLTTLQQRVLGIFVMAALLWIVEPVPVHATSMLILSALLIGVSDQSPWATADSPAYTEVLAALASPVIVLFLGGFALAICAADSGVDKLLAFYLLRPFTRTPRRLLWGVCLITALFSMFLSNTATTILMLTMLTSLSAAQPLPRSMLLAVPVAANIGGIGTPIGTPPNAIALQYLADFGHRVSFAQWMLLGMPIVVVLLATVVLYLQRDNDAGAQQIRLPTRTPPLDRHGWIVLSTLLSTMLLWLGSDIHGVNAYVVACLPLTVLPLAGLLGKDQLRQFDWDVIWLVAGGIALGRAIESTGLATVLVSGLFDSGDSTLWLGLGLTLSAWLLANFMSNTATANLLLPLAAATGSAGPQWMLAVAMACSLGMMLPISTPPNALAYASGGLRVNDLMKAGALIGLLGLLLLALWLLPMAHVILVALNAGDQDS